MSVFILLRRRVVLRGVRNMQERASPVKTSSPILFLALSHRAVMQFCVP